MIPFDIEPSFTEEEVDFRDIASYTILPSDLSLGERWPIQFVYPIPGTIGWGRGVVLIYGRAYGPIGGATRSTEVATIEADGSWRVRVTPDAARIGPGVEQVASFSPQIYLENAQGIQREVIALMRWVEAFHGVSLVSVDELTDSGSDYLITQAPGIQYLLPEIFASTDIVKIRPVGPAPSVQTYDMLTGAGGGDFFGDIFSDIGKVTGLSAYASAGFIVAGVGIAAAALVTVFSGNPAIGIPVLILAMALGAGAGWIDGRWVAVAVALELFAVAWVAFFKRA